MPKQLRYTLIFLLLTLFASACTRTWEADDASPWVVAPGSSKQETAAVEVGSPLTTARPPGSAVLTPTPDAPHPIPGLRTDADQYAVKPGDTLGQISDQFGVGIPAIAEANNIADINVLEVGQVLNIPAPETIATGSAFKIIPDSELVAGPMTAYFDVPDFVYQKNGYLVRHEEEVDGVMLNGFQIVQRISQDYSVNPRILLAVLEYQSNWVTNPNPQTYTLMYPLGWEDANRQGLYKQLAWAANELNRGYYLWRANAIASWSLPDGAIIPVDPTINAGTAAVQYFFSKLYAQEIWERNVNSDGIFNTFQNLFGYPFDYAIEPLLTPGLVQPSLAWPFETGVDWAFTGGPHGGWGDGSAWAALDFAPYGEPLGCSTSEAWVTAMNSGMIVRAENGAVVQDLDGDGAEQTGWTILYMHIETRDRVAVGTTLQTGERVGHPSCEGGISTGTHVHIARRYNGEWIPADQNIPFNIDGWISQGAGDSYNGLLVKGDQSIVAENGFIPENLIRR
ncbi:MAG: LysM peptidoglycan-binding domain-containing protein [Chloroflexi bacterium]|nr:LysM peptidoglycan-binding domain-containing protein [Chloroflexota bacterium]